MLNKEKLKNEKQKQNKLRKKINEFNIKEE